MGNTITRLFSLLASGLRRSDTDPLLSTPPNTNDDTVLSSWNAARKGDVGSTYIERGCDKPIS
jgi:hypothetical protein